MSGSVKYKLLLGALCRLVFPQANLANTCEAQWEEFPHA